ncbi:MULTISPECIES: hypothetical protein [unclassified Streptomyces]|uniref:hypothetical protein n=1 Tax=unclassified Streptomyces TaxID=2593676 RepID=UPI0029AD1291|nr:hypothetical protein [Streptomyces sp. DK15]MDX2392435.1 hypothetical protein [Streptomyces sp. DK15]
METLIEAALIVLLVAPAGWPARRTVARRAEARATSAADGAVVPIPCRARWRQGVRRRVFGYGKPGPGADGTGAVFKAPLRRVVVLPRGGRAAVRTGLRPGTRVLEYRAPDGLRVDFQVYDAEVDRAARILRIPDPADFR